MKLENYESFPTDLIVLQQEKLIYPFMIVPIFLSEEEEKEAVKKAYQDNKLLFIGIKKEVGTIGTIGTILREVRLPDGQIKILFQGLNRGKITKIKDNLEATIELIKTPDYNKEEINILIDSLKNSVIELIKFNPTFPRDIIKLINDNNDPDRIMDIISSNLDIKSEESYKIFSIIDIEEKLMALLKVIVKEIESAKLKTELAKKVSKNINEINREFFLKQQLQMIKEELGISDNKNEDIVEFQKKLDKIKNKIPKETYKEIQKQIDRLSKMHPESGEYSTTENYIDWALSIPFGKFSNSHLKIEELEKRLNRDHYGLETPKERIIDYFSAKELVELRGGEYKGAIICFVGPPGVGKTSLANSIAKSLNRELVRIALGGLEDVSELRGHRRTYIGSMPGRIIQGLINSKTMNPVIVLDEIDKIARHRGDPTSVLLEILDPEQNTHFRDLYLNFDIDLSQIIFIATANDISLVPAPLRDRLELIFVDSYTPNEKFEIAKKYLIPQEMKKHKLKKVEFSISDGAIKKIIDEYTKEAGVRNLRKIISKLMRKISKELLKDNSKKISITIKNLEKFLKKGFGGIDEVEKIDKIGVVNGLAWTAVGGDILKIEAIKIKGKGGITLTGSLGDVMKESARIALSVVRVLIDEGRLQIPDIQNEKKDTPYYKEFDIHIHFPAGATPKDGPSAGIAIVSVLSSIFSNTPIRHDIAMTGEVSLTGDVLPIGGLKEKLIAAYKAKIKEVLIPIKNYEKNLDDIPEEVKNGLIITPVKKIDEVIKKALILNK